MRVNPTNVVILGMKHDRVLRQVFQDRFQCFGPPQGIRRVQADANARARDSPHESVELRSAEGFVILKGQCDTLLMERRQNLPDFRPRR
jgi:hypothetical protein